MASVNDYGKTDVEALSQPKLGGNDGWAAAVAAALSNSDVPVDQRVGAKVSKAGDAMTGSLRIIGDLTFAGPKIILGPDGDRGAFRYAGRGLGFTFDDGDGSGSSNERQPLIIGNPTRVDHAVTKTYADASAGSEATFVPSSPWKDYGGSYAGLWLTRVGKVVHLEGLLSRSATLAVTAGATYNIGNFGTGWRPLHDIIFPGTFSFSGGSSIQDCRVTLTTAGALSFSSPVAGTMSVDTCWLALNGSYRVA